MALNLLQAIPVKKLEPDVVTFGAILCALQQAVCFWARTGKLEGGNLWLEKWYFSLNFFSLFSPTSKSVVFHFISPFFKTLTFQFFFGDFHEVTTVFLHSIFGKTGNAVGVDIGAAEPDGQLPGESWCYYLRCCNSNLCIGRKMVFCRWTFMAAWWHRNIHSKLWKNCLKGWVLREFFFRFPWTALGYLLSGVAEK